MTEGFVLINELPLTEAFIQTRLLHREGQLTELERCLKPALENRRISNVFLVGPTGSSRTIGRDYLFAETMRALRLWPDDKEMKKDVDKRNLLKHFQSMGCFLLDVSHTAVDKLDDPERESRLREGILRLIDEIETLKPEEIVIVKKNIFELVVPELEKLGLAGRILNKKFLPFPSYGNQLKYRKQLKQLFDSRK